MLDPLNPMDVCICVFLGHRWSARGVGTHAIDHTELKARQDAIGQQGFGKRMR
jgi:hypothetical protein